MDCIIWEKTDFFSEIFYVIGHKILKEGFSKMGFNEKPKSVLFTFDKLESPGQRDPQLRNCLDQIGLWAHLWGLLN